MGRSNPPPPDNRKVLIQYAGLSAQLCVSVGISLFLGLKMDKWLRVPFPAFAWGLPLLVIIGLIYMLIKESSRRNNGK